VLKIQNVDIDCSISKIKLNQKVIKTGIEFESVCVCGVGGGLNMFHEIVFFRNPKTVDWRRYKLAGKDLKKAKWRQKTNSSHQRKISR